MSQITFDLNNQFTALKKAPDKRTKPCARCRQYRYKCEYESTLPCKRCAKNNLVCEFPEPKGSSQASAPQDEWKKSVDSRLNQFGNALDMIMSHIQQQSQLPSTYTMPSPLPIFAESQPPYQPMALDYSLTEEEQARLDDLIKRPLPMEETPSKRQHIDNDFRTNGLLLKDEAVELFTLFKEKISHQLFGYDLSQYNVLQLWDSCPLLVASISCVASAHHIKYRAKFHELQNSVKHFAKEALVSYDGSNVYSTILGLCIAAFWLREAQMFTSLAIQLAHTVGLNEFPPPKDTQKLKLWYLLYNLDGNQSLAFHRKPLISSKEATISNSHKMLIDKNEGVNEELKRVLPYSEKDAEETKRQQLRMLSQAENKYELTHQTFNDMALIAQVEYNQAINTVFDENRWSEVMTPERFGIPWKTNMELDRWMISWTIALQNINIHNDVWPLKSTLLYYNFARMHINSSVIRRLKFNGQNTLPVWPSGNNEVAHTGEKASMEITVASAVALLRMVTKDKDVVSIFQFLPLHISVMMYYACLIVLNPPESVTYMDFHEDQGYNLVKNFRDMVASKMTTDQEFTDMILLNLDKELAKKPIIGKIVELDEKKPISAWPGSTHGHP